MITFYPEQHIKDLIIEEGQKEGLPGMGGGLIDARPHIRKLVDEMYAGGYVFAELQSGPVTEKILQQHSIGLQANVANLATFPPAEEAKELVAGIGKAAGIPGMGGGLIDTRRYVKFAVDKLGERNYLLCYLIREPATSAVWQRLYEGLPAVINEW